MKHSKICPKCQGTEIYTNAGMSKSGDRVRIPISGMVSLFTEVYICRSCGYIEEYIEPEDLNNEKKMKKLEEKFKRL